MLKAQQALKLVVNGITAVVIASPSLLHLPTLA
jgi:hypothetical protein